MFLLCDETGGLVHVAANIDPQRTNQQAKGRQKALITLAIGLMVISTAINYMLNYIPTYATKTGGQTESSAARHVSPVRRNWRARARGGEYRPPADLPTYATKTLHLSGSVAFTATLVAGIILTVVTPIKTDFSSAIHATSKISVVGVV
jgi:hypothetical protein